MKLRLRQNLELSWKDFIELKLDLEYFCPSGERRGFRINLTKQEWKENNVKRKGSKVKGKRRVM